MPKPDPRYYHMYACRPVREVEEGELKLKGKAGSQRIEYHTKKTTYSICLVKQKTINESIDAMSYEELEDLVRTCLKRLLKNRELLVQSMSRLV